ncbi:MAG TPA: hypothetical protein PLL26_06660 [Candidatus Dojkabacteria bacterium]|nr:hypothetical protein [Candidatus Dojkabacteria bacterium]
MKTIELSNKERADLVKKVSSLDFQLSKKEKNLFQKILEKGIKNWSENDIEFISLLYDLHYSIPLGVCGCSIYPYEQEEQIIREEKAKKEFAVNRLNEEPYSLWFQNIRKYR